MGTAGSSILRYPFLHEVKPYVVPIITTFLVEIVVLEGIPTKVVKENTLFNSTTFSKFVTQWVFMHTMSSPS